MESSQCMGLIWKEVALVACHHGGKVALSFSVWAQRCQMPCSTWDSPVEPRSAVATEAALIPPPPSSLLTVGEECQGGVRAEGFLCTQR